jgi:hypothetical protein
MALDRGAWDVPRRHFGIGCAPGPIARCKLDGEPIRSAVPPLLFGLRLWASVCLALYAAFSLKLDNAFWAGRPRSGARCAALLGHHPSREGPDLIVNRD